MGACEDTHWCLCEHAHQRVGKHTSEILTCSQETDWVTQHPVDTQQVTKSQTVAAEGDGNFSHITKRQKDPLSIP